MRLPLGKALLLVILAAPLRAAETRPVTLGLPKVTEVRAPYIQTAGLNPQIQVPGGIPALAAAPEGLVPQFPGTLGQPAPLEAPAEQAAQAGRQVFDAGGPGLKGAVGDWVRGLAQAVIPHPAVTEARAKAALPGIHAAHAETWRARSARRPEEANGLTEAQALKLLSRLEGSRNPASGGTHVRNGTYFQSLAGGQSAVVKKVQQRSEMGDGRVYTFSNDIRFEVLAYQLDRYLGTNLVPPALRLGPDAVAQLKVRAGPIGLGAASRDPANLMELSHLSIIDLMLGNADRKGPDNLLVDQRDKLAGIDFDLSRPSGYFTTESVEPHLHVEGVLIEPGRFWSRGALPGVFSGKVLARLNALDRPGLEALARRGGFKLTAGERDAILSMRHGILQSIENLKARYGAGFIELP